MADPVEQPTSTSRRKGPVGLFLRGQAIYFKHIWGLLAPGKEIAVVAAHQVKPGSLEKWDKEDFERMIEEGHRQLDRQLSDLEQIRSRAQWLFTVGAAVTASLGGAFATTRPSGAILALWLLAFLVLVYGVAGAAAIMTVRADFATIDTALLSQSTPPILKSLATSYSRMLGTGENTVATRLTVFRQAVLFVIVGGYLGLLAVLVHG
jgi:hypothetical protein